jgi:ABC-type bacteriocin/lantibiotic exporter with double-glycine peptidase domain
MMTAWGRRLRASAAVSAILVSGCSYLGSARDFDPCALDREPSWIALRSVPQIRQESREDCGVAAIMMMLAYWDRPVCRDQILEACPAKPGEGIRAGDLRDFARHCGLQAYLFHGDWQDFQVELDRHHPVLVGLVKPYVFGNVSHYEVVVGFRPETREILTLDPANGWRKNSAEGFLREWEPAGRLTLVIFQDAPEEFSAARGP